MAVCLTIFTENQEWYTFVPLEDAVAAAATWKANEGTWLDVTGVDADQKAQRAIFELASVIGLSISDARRWKPPSPPPERQ